MTAPNIHESAMAEMLHNFYGMADMLGPFLDQHQGLRTEFEAIRKEGDAALEDLNRAAQRCALVGSRIITFAQHGQRLL